MSIRHGGQSAVPSGLIAVANPNPSAEALGYYRESLRDQEIEILVALDASSARITSLVTRGRGVRAPAPSAGASELLAGLDGALFINIARLN